MASEEEVAATIAYLEGILKGVHASRFTTTAGYVVLLYDWLLTLPDEVALIWPGPWGLVKVLFFINRFAAPIFLLLPVYQFAGFRPALTTEYCRISIAIVGFAQHFGTFCSTWLLTLRVGALYGQQRRVLIPLYIGFVGAYAAALLFAALALKSLITVLEYVPVLHICATEEVHWANNWIFTPPAIYEVVILGLTMYKALGHARYMRRISDAPMLYTLYRDGILYFLLVVSLRIWCTTIVWTLPHSYLFLGSKLLPKENGADKQMSRPDIATSYQLTTEPLRSG